MKNFHQSSPCRFYKYIFLCFSSFFHFLGVFPSALAEPINNIVPSSATELAMVHEDRGGRSAAQNMVKEEDAFILEQNKPEVYNVGKGREATFARSFSISNVITLALAAAVVTMIVLIARDFMYFVGDVPDPFEHISAAQDIPSAIRSLIDSNTPIAFVVR